MEKNEHEVGTAENGVNVDSMWNCITSSLTQQPIEIETVHLDGSNGVWFLASFRQNGILIDQAVVHQPSNVNHLRISEVEFKKRFPDYFSWRNGTCPRNKIRDTGQHSSSYIFAIIEYFLNR
ncbi:hypothetical protein AGMMS49579_02330 [Spirochaetia bacterium]|nr:hypothetical protein AGMMS49579_01940 [Spirochaetia bacterium]GHV49782.1 hypothetical protein AGMMS49579_02330 [Spirochaetia bacterium]